MDIVRKTETDVSSKHNFIFLFNPFMPHVKMSKKKLRLEVEWKSRMVKESIKQFRDMEGRLHTNLDSDEESDPRIRSAKPMHTKIIYADKNMKKNKRLLMIDYNAPMRIIPVGEGSCTPTFTERMRAYRLMVSRKGLVCGRYRGISGIFRLLIQIARNESMSLFRFSQQQTTSKDTQSPEFERWAREMEGLQERPQCGQGSDDITSSSLRSSSSEGR